MNSNLLNIDEQDIFRRAIEIAFDLGSPLQNPNVQSAYKKLVNSIQNRTPLLTPSTVESPFSKEELERIEQLTDGSTTHLREIDTIIHNKATHLLTAANEFPCLMEVKTSIDTWIKTMVYGIYDGQFMTRIQGDDEYYGYKHARPIEQKQKELKDLKEGDFFWDIETLEKRGYQGRNNVLIIYNKDGVDCVVAIKDFDNYFQLAPPTSAQFTAAEEAAINEVKARFDKARKEVEHG